MNAAADPARATRAAAAPGAAAAPVVAVMQPYVFPYLGYFSLVDRADHFVFYDDVAHIPRGWVNRNRVLVNGAAHTFTVPVVKASQNQRIDEVLTHDFAAFRRRFMRQLECAYRRAPHFEATWAWVGEVLAPEAPGLAELAMRSVQAASRRLGLDGRKDPKAHFLRSSGRFAASRGLGRAERLIHITRALGASRYFNSPGGAALYDPAEFAAHGVSLRFVRPRLAPYAQVGGGAFVSGLSVIDALMHLPVAEVARQVRDVTFDGAPGPAAEVSRDALSDEAC